MTRRPEDCRGRDPQERRPLGRRGSAWLAALAVLGLGALIASAATPSLIWVQKPTQGAVVGLEGVAVMVRFPNQGRVEAESFRLRLNGADVTASLTTGENGAFGHLYELLDGENVLRFEIRGDRGGYPPGVVRETREVHVLVRRPQDLDRG